MSTSVSGEMISLGKATTEWALRGSDCPILLTQGIEAIGVSKAGPGYRVWRENPSFSNVHLTISGGGEAWVEGRWRRIGEGMAILSPGHCRHGSRTVGHVAWEFCWICFAEPRGKIPVIDIPAPMIVRADPKPLSWAMLSFEREFREQRNMPLLELLLKTITLRVRRFAQASCDDPLWKLWERVAHEPSADWSMPVLARAARVSERHLLRICRRQLGRTAGEQVTHLRMTKASALLQTSHFTLAAIAEEVGYRDAFAFSKAFKKWTGVSPSRYRLP